MKFVKRFMYYHQKGIIVTITMTNYEANEFTTVVEIVGLEEGGRGRSCIKHNECGSCVKKHMILRVRKVIIVNDEGHREVALALYVLKYGEETCHVGFLRRHHNPFMECYDGKFLQVTCLFAQTNDYNNIDHNWHMHGAGEAFLML